MLTPRKGRLLISEPSLIEEIFFKSVILLTHHSSNESIGLILNNPAKIKLNEIINDVPLSDFPVYIGGPVEKNTIHFIHTLGRKITGSKELIQGLYWGGDFKIVLDLMLSNKISNKDIRFFIGYSGWQSQQLSEEIGRNEWLINKSNKKICMQYSTSELWRDLIKNKKRKYAIWSNMPKNPNLN